jgi:hypothetical protein
MHIDRPHAMQHHSGERTGERGRRDADRRFRCLIGARAGTVQFSNYWT